MRHTPEPPQRPAAWYRGREAFFAGGALADCPYREGSADRQSWIAAYRAAEQFRRELDDHLERQA